MGIAGFYSYCKKEVPKAFKEVKILDEISKYKSDHGKAPLIVVNLSTLCYHYRVKKGFFLAEHRINKLKHSIEGIFERLKDAGAELVFMFKRAKFDDEEFLGKSIRDSKTTQKLLQELERTKNDDHRKKLLQGSGQLPHNVLVLLAMLQSAKKFGEVHYINSYDFKPVVAQKEFIDKSSATWVIGLDTYFFLMDGDWKILADDTLNQEAMTFMEVDRKLIMERLELESHHLPLLATLLGDFDSKFKFKLSTFFGSVTKFKNVFKFVKSISHPLTEQSYEDIAAKIFGAKQHDPQIVQDLKKSVKQFMYREVDPAIDEELAELIKDDLLNYAPLILMDKVPLFISSDMIDLTSDHTKDYLDLVLPWIQKTAGILLKSCSSMDAEPPKVIVLRSADGNYETESLEVIYPDFEVPPLKLLLTGEMATYDKEKMLFYVVGEKLEKIELPSLGQDDLVDCIILLYLIHKKKITVLEARCILLTIVHSRSKGFDDSFEKPKSFNTRAMRCSILYMKLFFEMHSCLGALGMKNYCPEFTFDGAYFQKLYAINVLGEKEEEEDGKANEEAQDADDSKATREDDKKQKEEAVSANYTQTDIVDSFARILTLH